MYNVKVESTRDSSPAELPVSDAPVFTGDSAALADSAASSDETDSTVSTFVCFFCDVCFTGLATEKIDRTSSRRTTLFIHANLVYFFSFI
jgi:hypothetical protein